MSKRTPIYQHHKASGRGVVTFNGKDHYLPGPFGCEESKAAYHALIAKWEANGRRLPTIEKPPDLTVSELLLLFWEWAEQNYRTEDGEQSRELDNIKDAIRPLRRLFGATLGVQFGPLCLRAVRDEMIRAGLARSTINSRVDRVRRIFKWAASMEHIPCTIYQALTTVRGLERGRCQVKETEPVAPVPQEHVDAILPFVLPPVAAMIRVQLLTACRAGEVVIMRGCDLDMGKEVWEYRPMKHKGTWLGKGKVIFIGPQAQLVIRPFLKLDTQAPLFSPREALAEQLAIRKANRKEPIHPCEVKRGRKKVPRRQPGERYTVGTYYQAIVRACRRAGVPEWSPLQLRHTAATEIRSRYGLEAAQVILGHSRADVTQIYAERDLGKAQEVIRQIG